MSYKQDLERMVADWDSVRVDAGPFRARYVEEYTEELDVQGVNRTLTAPRHVLSDRNVVAGTVIREVITIDERRLGPFQVKEFQPAGAMVTLVISEYQDPS